MNTEATVTDLLYAAVPLLPVTIKVVPDDSPESPREWDNLGVMACWHRRYNLGDEQPSETPEEWLKENAPKGSVILPLYLLDHSGLRISTGSFRDPWDSGQVGVVVATPDAIRKAYNCKRISKRVRALAEKCLRQEVETYDDFLTGNVWGYVIERSDGEHVDSCFGFFGDDLDGMKYHVDAEYHEALVEAWDNRFH